ncbi:hypothetical protein BDN72DRAFT_139525 [Pluteus cervinus]|uniref:Uncharacterized protein n=1 Tax=Pluteus cervinus TaxID=181527 RepID=A0ACD3ALJ6_9AGAR|nr:hypothetical protein BDN72DRAFT_139525 [Pluteus cervinus]
MGAYDDILGLLLVGVIINTYLYGIVTFQYASYRNAKFNDPPWIRLLVLSLFCIDTVHSASVIYALYVICVQNFGNVPILLTAIWPIPFTPIAIAISASITQTFLAYRIWRLTGNVYYYIALMIAITVAFACGLTCGIKAMRFDLLSEFSKLNTLASIWLSLQMGIDAVITTTLIYILSQSKTGFRSTDSIINRLIRGCIQSGLLCEIVSIFSLVYFITKPETNHYTMFAICIGRVYTNTLMDTVLARENLRDIFSTSRGDDSKNTVP